MDSVSRANGGMFEAERRLQKSLRSGANINVQVVGLQDVHTTSDLPAWSPLLPTTLPIKGPSSFGYAPGFLDHLLRSDADLAYLAGLWKFPALATLRWTRRTRRPVIVAPHGMLDPWALRNSGRQKKIAALLFQDPLLRRAACLRALCAAEARAMRAYGLKNPICVIPNGIDPPASSVAPLPFAFPGRKVLLHLGRIHPKKGLASLLVAWSQLAPQNKDWILALAGWDQGGHEAELKRQATERQIPWSASASETSQRHSLVFLGPQFGQDKAAWYQRCDAFILPSLSEGLPIVVLEAWAAAKPVLMTPQCNLPEGFIAKAALQMDATSQSIFLGLQQLFAMSDGVRQAMGACGATLVESHFAWPKIATEMAAVYSWVLGRGPSPASVCIL